MSVQRRRADRGAEPAGVPPVVYEVLRSPGRQLDAPTRGLMEPRLGHDFSRVRVHTDARAAESARAVSALAYTVGRDVVFAAGRYAPETAEGAQLLAHELTHVVQQRGADAAAGGRIEIGAADAQEEKAADAFAASAASALRGHGQASSTPASSPLASPGLAARRTLQRQPDTGAPSIPGVSATVLPEGGILDVFDVDKGQGKRPWKLDQLSKYIAAGLLSDPAAYIEVIGLWDANVEAQGGQELGTDRQAARRRSELVRNALIQWVPVPKGRIVASTLDQSILSAEANAFAGRQVAVLLRSKARAAIPEAPAQPQTPSAEAGPQAQAGEPGQGGAAPGASGYTLVLQVALTGAGKGAAGGLGQKIPPPIVLEPPQSLVGAVLKYVAKDANKLIDSPLGYFPLPAKLIIDALPKDWEVRKKIREALQDFDKPPKSPPLTDQGTFADPRFRDIEGEQKRALEDLPFTILQALILVKPGAVIPIPAPTRGPGETVIFFKIPAIPLP